MNTYTLSIDTDDGKFGIRGLKANIPESDYQLFFNYLTGRVRLRAVSTEEPQDAVDESKKNE